MAIKTKSRRLKLLRSHKKKPGAPPGTLVAPADSPPPEISIISYGPDTLEEHTLDTPDDIQPFLETGKRLWINVNGLGDLDILEKIGNIFHLHPLALEDVLNLEHRSKTDSFEDYLFIVSRMVQIKTDETHSQHDSDKSGASMPGRLDIEQISLFVANTFVLTFQERPGDILEPVRVRLRNGKGRPIREKGTDYLAYAIIDAVIDGYFPVLEHYSDHMNIVEDQALQKPTKKVMADIHALKRDLRTLRQNAWPMREMVNNFRSDTTVVSDEIAPFIRDCYEHIINVLDMLETNRERASSLTDIYLSSLSKKTNDIMQVLTVIATIFIPLTFIAGIYGMNFDTSSPWNMPELSWRFGYPAVWGLMLFVAGVLLLFFRSRGWLGGSDKE